MSLIGSAPAPYSGRRTLRLIVPVAVLALLLTIPAHLIAQDDASPTPMSTPDAMVLPAVAIFPYPAYGTAPMTVGFVPQIHDPAGEEVVMYKWNFGDGNVATTPPLVTYNVYKTPGVYVASLTIETADGRSATGFASVTVKAPETSSGQSG
jgi:PKD repeat protein